MRNIFTKCLFLLSLLYFSSSVFCQHKKNYLFTRYGKVNGLAADVAFSVAQDNRGYIWVGSDRGLQRYDGKRFITFRHNPSDSTSLSSNSIGGLHHDKKGRLWVLFFDQTAGYFNTSTFVFTPVKLNVPTVYKKNNFRKFMEDPDGTIHIGIVGYGVITYHEKNNEFSAKYNVVQLPDGKYPNEIHTTQKQGEYLVTGNETFDIYNSSTRQWMRRDSTALLRNMNKMLTQDKALGPGHILADGKGRIWVDLWLDGTREPGPYVFSYHPADDDWQNHKRSVDIAARGYHSINGFLEQKNGDIWLYGTSVFAKFNEEEKIFEDYRNETLLLNGVDMETIYQLYEDKDGNIWIACTNGLYMFNPERQVFSNLKNKRGNPPELYTHSVDAVIQSRNGTIYSSTWGAGIFAYDNNLNIVPNPILPGKNSNNGLAVWDMHERTNGEIWMAEQGGFIKIFDPAAKKTITIQARVFNNKTVRQVVEDSLGNMWMGTQSGRIIKCVAANYKDTNAFEIVHELRGRITKLVADKFNSVWVCTDRYGLYRLNAADGNIIAHYNDELPAGKRLQLSGANDILQYNDSIFLIASGDMNILNIKNNSITYAGAGGGIDHSSLNSIVKDKQGYIWLAFSDGLGRMEYNKQLYLFFEREDGILNSHFQINASTVLNDGRILFGTNTDMLLFNPAEIRFREKPVPVNISGFQSGNNALSVDSLLHLKSIKVPYYNSTFSIDLTTFNYHDDYAVLYMLEGADNEWVFSTTQRASYNRLPPGKYIFKTKSVSATGNESPVTSIMINVVPPFWQTAWFYGLIILSGLVLFYLVDRERVLRLKSTQKLRTNIAISLHHDVNTALNNINLLSEMARIKADKDIERSKELIGQISEKSNDMIIAMDDMLWVIDPVNDSMEKMLMRMREFIDALRNRHEADILLRIDEKLKDLKPDMRLRHGFYFIFKGALRCMVQYAGAKQTLVNIDLQKKNLCLTIKASAALDLEEIQMKTLIREMKIHAGNTGSELDIQNDRNESNVILFMPLN